MVILPSDIPAAGSMFAVSRESTGRLPPWTTPQIQEQPFFFPEISPDHYSATVQSDPLKSPTEHMKTAESYLDSGYEPRFPGKPGTKKKRCKGERFQNGSSDRLAETRRSRLVDLVPARKDEKQRSTKHAVLDTVKNGVHRLRIGALFQHFPWCVIRQFREFRVEPSMGLGLRTEDPQRSRPKRPVFDLNVHIF
jgi:hypothetical protein